MLILLPHTILRRGMNYEYGITHEMAQNYSGPYTKFEQKTITVQKFIFHSFKTQPVKYI